MANEIRIRFKLDYNPASGDSINVPWKDIYISQTGTDFTTGTQSIGTSAEEAVSVSSDIGTQGWWVIENLDSTNFVEVGKVKVSADGDSLPIKILAGEFAVFRASSSIYAKADTSSVQIRYWCFES